MLPPEVVKMQQIAAHSVPDRVIANKGYGSSPIDLLRHSDYKKQFMRGRNKFRQVF